MLPGICPSCGLKADLEVFAAQAEVRQALAAALLLPAALGRRALAYLRLFAPEQKSLSLAKAGRLLAELQAAVASGQVRRHGVDRAAPLALWELALDVLADRPPESLPLRDHAYLFQTVWNLAEKAAARQEERGEQRKRQALTPGPSPRGRGEDGALTPDPSPRGRGEAVDLAQVAAASRAAFEAQRAQQPPPRSGPPADFRALVGKLTGVGQFDPTNPTETEHEQATENPAPQALSPGQPGENSPGEERVMSG